MASRSQIGGDVSSHAATNAEPSAAWESVAAEATKAVAAALEPRLKKLGDDLYSDLLYTVQDYLLENVLYNVQSWIDAADRQANADRQRATDAEREVQRLRRALTTAHGLCLTDAPKQAVGEVLAAAISKAEGQP